MGSSGGGAGGLVQSSANGISYDLSPISYTVAVGGGGASLSTNGTNSSITSSNPNFAPIIAYGGGRGGEGGDEAGADGIPIKTIVGAMPKHQMIKELFVVS